MCDSHFTLDSSKMACMEYTENGFYVTYLPEFLKGDVADQYLKQLSALPFDLITTQKPGEMEMFRGRMLAFGDVEDALPWSPLMQELRDSVEKQLGCSFNFGLVQYYVTGSSSYQKDPDSHREGASPTAVLSFGEKRTLQFKKPKSQPVSIDVHHGSLYVIYKPTSEHFTRRLLTSSEKARVSITFRHFVRHPDPPLKKSRQMTYTVQELNHFPAPS